MSFALEPIKSSEREQLENLFQFYMHDLSEFVPFQMDARGRFRYDFSRLDIYWQSPSHAPFFIKHAEKAVGFVLVRELDCFDVEQFFVLRSHRRLGLGKTAFQRVSEMFPGAWQIRVLPNSFGALQFWLDVASAVTKSGYIITEENDVNRIMRFIRFETP